MRTRPAGFLLALALAAGCTGSPPEQVDEALDAHAHGASREAESPDDLLRIDAEMLRDLRITTAAVEARGGGEGLTVLGELRVDEAISAEVGSSVTARVLRIFAGPGDIVAPGAALAELQSVELGRAHADYLGARARAELARRTLARKRSLGADRIVAQREVQEAEATATAADADLRAAQAALGALGVSPDGPETTADADASRFTLRAPLAGTVIERTATLGQQTDPARPLFRIADLSRLWLVVHPFERDAVRVREGTPARVTLPALPGRSYSGTVALVGRQVEPGSRTIPVRVVLANEDGMLRPGMSATAWLALGDGAGTVVTVPAAALQRLHEGWCAFLPRAPGTFERRVVGRGRELGGEVEVISGLAPGETVVVEGAFLLKAEAEKSRGEGEHHEH